MTRSSTDPFRVLVLGGAGNFGGRAARLLATERRIRLILGGRNRASLETAADALAAAHPPEIATLDIDRGIDPHLANLRPDAVLHTAGPFQARDYQVAEDCIAAGCHYLDLADAREFVAGFSALDARARAAGVLAVSGASSLPALSSAIADAYLPHFSRFETLDYGIATAQQTRMGLATARALLSYAGRPFEALSDGACVTRHGWGGLRRVSIGGLGERWVADCDVPDLALFPARYPDLRTIRFSAGVEVAAIQFGLWALAGLSRFRLLPRLDRLARPMLAAARLFDRFGSARSGFFMQLEGIGTDSMPKQVRFELLAKDGTGPDIPVVPAVLLLKALARGEIDRRGAMACVGLLTLEELLAELRTLGIEDSCAN